MDDYELGHDGCWVKKEKTYPLSEYERASRGMSSKDYDNQGGW